MQQESQRNIDLGKKPLLLVIDMQVGFWHSVLEDVHPNILRLAESRAVPVVASQFFNPPESLFHSQLHWYRFTEEKDVKLIDSLEKLKPHTIRHGTYTVWNDELRSWAKQHEIDHVYIAGVFTDVCVTKTAMDVFDDNIPVSVIPDAVHTLHGQPIHDATIRALGQIIGYKALPDTQHVLDIWRSQGLLETS